MEKYWLITNNWRYAWRRVSFFYARQVLNIGIRFVEFTYIFLGLELSYSFVYLIMRYAFQVILNYRWGSLEDLRQEISELKDFSFNRQKLVNLINGSTQRSFLFFLFCVLMACCLLVIAFKVPIIYLSLNLTIASALVIRLGADWVVKTLQSIVYPYSRIYRSFTSFIFSDIIFLLVIFSTYPWIKSYSLPLTIFIDTIIRSTLGIIFTFQTFSKLSLPLISLRQKFSWKFSISQRGLTLVLLEIVQISVLWMLMKKLSADLQQGQKAFFFYLAFSWILSLFSFRFLYYVDLVKFNILQPIKKIVVKQMYLSIVLASGFVFLGLFVMKWWFLKTNVLNFYFVFPLFFVFLSALWGNLYFLLFLRKMKSLFFFLMIAVGWLMIFDVNYLFILCFGFAAVFFSILPEKNDRKSVFPVKFLFSLFEKDKGYLTKIVLDKRTNASHYSRGLFELLRILPAETLIARGRGSIYVYSKNDILNPIDCLKIFGYRFLKIEKIEKIALPRDVQKEEFWRLGKDLPPQFLLSKENREQFAREFLALASGKKYWGAKSSLMITPVYEEKILVGATLKLR